MTILRNFWLISPSVTINFSKMITNPSHQDDELQVETRSQRRRYLLHMGSWAPDSLKFMKDLGTRVTEATGKKNVPNLSCSKV